MKHAKRVFGVIAMLAVLTLLLSLVAGPTIEAAYNGPWTTQTINGRREKIYDWVRKLKKYSSYFQVYIQTQHQPGYPETGGEVDYIDFDNPLYLSGEKWELGVKNIKDGYQFVSWTSNWPNQEKNGSNLIIRNHQRYDGWATVLFQFIGYEITLNLKEGGTFNSNSGAAYTDRYGRGAIPVPAHTLTPGYTLAGWDQALNATASTTINAIYDVDLSFESNGGSAENIQRVRQGGTPASLPTPTRLGYSFTGWHTDADLINRYQNTAISQPTTLYAGWTPNFYNVNYIPDPGTLSDPAPMSVGYNMPLGVLRVPTRIGWTFVDWNTAADGSGEQVNSETLMPANDLNIYAQWEPNVYSVNFDLNGGDEEIPPQSKTYETTVDTVADPSRLGYGFLGWRLDGQESYWDFATDKVTEDIVLRAEWEPSTYTISFGNGDAWTSPLQNVSVVYTNPIPMPAREPKRLGYQFEGWHFDGGPWDFSAEILPQDMTLTPVFNIKKYTVSFVGNADDAGNIPAALSNIEYLSVVQLPDAVPTRPGYIFVEWNTQPNGAGQSAAELFAEGMVLNDVKLYAQWRKAR